MDTKTYQEYWEQERQQRERGLEVVRDPNISADQYARDSIGDVMHRSASSAAADAGVALDPMAFEQHVIAASKPAPVPEIRAQLLAFVRRHAPGTSVVRAECRGFAHFDWRTGVLTLSPETAKGEGMRSLLVVAHECGHANQKRDMAWLPWWALKVPLLRLWLEDQAWRRALAMLS